MVNKLLKPIYTVLILLIAISSYADTALQIDFLLAGYRHPTTNRPLSGGKVYTFLDGTSTLSALWTDKDKGGTATNPIILDSAGKAEVYGDDIYKIVIYDSSDNLIETINGAEYVTSENTAVGNSSIVRKFDSVAAMVAATNLSVGDIVETVAYYSTLDGGCAMYEIVAAATGTNNGITYINLNTHQAKLLYDGTIGSKQAGVKHDATTDNTTQINTLFALGVSTEWDSGTVGAVGPITCAMSGQTHRGSDSVGDGSVNRRGGTIFKRLSGTAAPFFSFTGDDGVIDGFSFDDNNSSVDNFYISCHAVSLSNIVCYNQNSGGIGFTANSVNISIFSRITCDNAQFVNNTLYTDVHEMFIVGGTSGQTLKFDSVEKMNFYGLILGNSSDSYSVGFSTFAINMHFYGTRGELGGYGVVVGLQDSLIRTISGGDFRNISFDGFEFSAAFASNAAYFEMEDVYNFSLSNAYIPATATAGTFVILKGCTNSSFENILMNYTNNFTFLNVATQSNVLSVKNCNWGINAGIGSIILRTTGANISLTNMLVSGGAASDQITFSRAIGSIDLTNITQAHLINSPTYTNRGGSISTVFNGTYVGGYATVASASSISIPSGGTIHITGTTTIGTIASGSSIPGRKVTLVFDAAACNVVDGTILLNGTFTSVTAGDNLTLLCDKNGVWTETSRSIN